MTEVTSPAGLDPAQAFRYRVARHDLAEAEALELVTAEPADLLLTVSRLTGTVHDLLRLVDQLAAADTTTAPGGTP